MCIRDRLGIILLTIGFFAAHSTASGWVGHIATHARAEASSLYVFFYYLGSSILGALSGMLFDSLPWAGFIATYALMALGIAGMSWVVRKNG